MVIVILANPEKHFIKLGKNLSKYPRILYPLTWGISELINIT